MEIKPESEINKLPLVGPQLTKAFYNQKINTVTDLLYNFPLRYMDYRKKVNISQIQEGETVTVVGRIKTVSANHGFRSRLPYTDITIEDGTGKIKAIWFNQTYIAKQLQTGDEIIISGKVSRYKQLQFTNPAYEQLNIDDEGLPKESLHTGRLVPIYRRSDLVPLRTMRRLVKSCLGAANDLEDYVSKKVQKQFNLLSIGESVKLLHFPDDSESVTEGRFRIAVDDVLPQQIAVQIKKLALNSTKAPKIKTDIEKVKLFLKTLPFELTPSQKRAAWDIFQDMESGHPMNRLLQGDVGSGKTIVAILAALQVVGNGKQVVVLAPTEVLAKQHYDTFSKILQTDSGIALLTRHYSESNQKTWTKPELLKKISNSEVQICIGTHALLQEKIKFKNLSLVVIDEQHRFGVGQRGWLFKTAKTKQAPHLLSMSATPIPRTLAMSMYADLAISTLSHVPTGRKPIQTSLIVEKERVKIYEFIRQEAAKGRQAFIVTPRVEEPDESKTEEGLAEVRSVKKEFAKLQKDVFPKLNLGLLYGKMKGAEKDRIMSEFTSGKIDVLVSTSVIEIGIDIPNATCMIIEGAERFGLAQLHQLRGRVGRSDHQSYCFLFTTEDSQQDTQRLQALSKTNDGFALAELDLKERGFGDLFGKQQSGFLFRFPQFITTKALVETRKIAEVMIKKPKDIELLPTQLRINAEEYLKDMHNE